MDRGFDEEKKIRWNIRRVAQREGTESKRMRIGQGGFG